MTSLSDRALETRRDLAHFYSNLSLQYAGFALVMLLAFVTLLTNHAQVQSLPFGNGVFLAVLFPIVVLGIFSFARVVLWSAVATVTIYRDPLPLGEGDDVLKLLAAWYVDKAREKQKLAYRIGYTPVKQVLIPTFIAGVIGALLGFLF
jgi:hypothetical protein